MWNQHTRAVSVTPLRRPRALVRTPFPPSPIAPMEQDACPVIPSARLGPVEHNEGVHRHPEHTAPATGTSTSRPWDTPPTSLLPTHLPRPCHTRCPSSAEPSGHGLPSTRCQVVPTPPPGKPPAVTASSGPPHPCPANSLGSAYSIGLRYRPPVEVSRAGGSHGMVLGPGPLGRGSHCVVCALPCWDVDDIVHRAFICSLFGGEG